MVINKFGDRLYSGLEETQRQHLRNVALLISDAQGGEGLLRELKLRWDNHNKSMQMIRDVLMVRVDVFLEVTMTPSPPTTTKSSHVPHTLCNPHPLYTHTNTHTHITPTTVYGPNIRPPMEQSPRTPTGPRPVA